MKSSFKKIIVKNTDSFWRRSEFGLQIWTIAPTVLLTVNAYSARGRDAHDGSRFFASDQLGTGTLARLGEALFSAFMRAPNDAPEHKTNKQKQLTRSINPKITP